MNITKLTESYISEHPSVRDSITSRIVNYSALSRDICLYHKIKKFDAVLVACRRYSQKTKGDALLEKRIESLVKDAKLRIRNKIAVIIIEKPRDMDTIYQLQKHIKKKRGDFNLIEGEEVITIITNIEFLEAIKKNFTHRIIKITQDVVLISLVFNKLIETTSGVVSHVYSLLAENSINILEEMSCWTDILIVIDEKDLAKTMRVLA
jgi:aspartokinase